MIALSEVGWRPPGASENQGDRKSCCQCAQGIESGIVKTDPAPAGGPQGIPGAGGYREETPGCADAIGDTIPDWAIFQATNSQVITYLLVLCLIECSLNQSLWQ